MRALLWSGASGTGAFGYGTLLERHQLSVERLSLSMRGLGTAFDGFRMVQISDLHLEPNTDAGLLGRCVDAINALKPDLIALTGDYITSDASRVTQLMAPLSGLKATAGVVASLGNHDVWTSSRKVSLALYQHGIRLLRNSGLALTRQGESLWIAGLDSVWGGHPDVREGLRGQPKAAPCVILAHEPDYADTLATQVSSSALQLAGHTHGGQVCIPGGFPIHLPAWGRKYPKGLFQLDHLHLYVNRGLGTIGPKARFACSPEITEITLRSA